MNILVPDSWLREYLNTDAKPKDIQRALSLCGPSVDKIDIVKDDCIYNIEITSNRIDTASVYGIAREAAAILPRFGFKAILKNLKLNKGTVSEDGTDPIDVSDPNRLCHRILAVVMDNVHIGHSPRFIKDRLEKSGVRALNNIIDITNYVMLELGHPIHVFDYDRIRTGKLLVRKAQKGEILITLDGKKHILGDEDIIIDDSTGRIIDLPGIMGAENSVVTAYTKKIIVFIESNDPVAIRKTSMRLGIRTMAASINEKGPDINLAETSINRAIDLYHEIAGAHTSSRFVDIFPFYQQPASIRVSLEFINKRLGIPLSKKEAVSILKTLNFALKDEGKDIIHVTPPSFRSQDISIPEDIVEEVARIYGYHNLPSHIMSGIIPTVTQDKRFDFEYHLKTMLKYWGYTEIFTYSFISHEQLTKSGLEPGKSLRLANPLTEEIEYMRPSLIPSMLSVIKNNQHLRGNLMLFEIANVYLPQDSELPEEKRILQLSSQKGFFDLKGTVEQMLTELGIAHFQETSDEEQFLHTGQSLKISIGDEILAHIGKLKPALKENFSLSRNTYVVMIDVRLVQKHTTTVKKYSKIPLYPPVFEEITISVPDTVTVGEVMESMATADPLVQNIELTDKFRGNFSFRIAFLDNTGNLTKEQSQGALKKILSQLQSKFNIKNPLDNKTAV